MADVTFYGLSADQVQLIQDFIDTVRKYDLSGEFEEQADIIQSNVACYIARTPSAGIPALDEAGTGTTTDDAPGSADCQIFEIDDDDEMSPVEDYEETVYNLADTDIPGNTYVTVIRDQISGKFVALVGTAVSPNFMGKADFDIPAMSGGLAGSGEIVLWEITDTFGTLAAKSPEERLTVYNLSQESVLADRMVQGKYIGDKPVIDMESCGTPGT